MYFLSSSNNSFGIGITRDLPFFVPLLILYLLEDTRDTDLITDNEDFSKSISVHYKGITSPERKPQKVIIIAAILAR